MNCILRDFLVGFGIGTLLTGCLVYIILTM